MKKPVIKLKKINFRELWAKRPRLSRGWRVFTIVSLSLCAAALICSALFRAAASSLPSQLTAQKWAGTSESKFEQISVFFPEGSSFDKNSIMGFRQKVKDNSANAVPKGVKNLMTDAWSTTGKVSIVGGHGSSSASVLAVGGNYFYFHALELVSGGYFSDDDLMNDRVLLDEELAWKLYGGSDLAGLSVTINGKPFVVAGVISREDDKADKTAYTDGVGLYMSYDAYAALNTQASAAATDTAAASGTGTSKGTGTSTGTGNGTGTSTGTGTGTGTSTGTGTGTGMGTGTAASTVAISCYEAVLPNPVKNFAYNLAKTELNPDGKNAVVDNSARYTSGSIWQLIKGWGKRSMHSDTIKYPYWENAARLVENRCALYMLLELIFWICPAAFAAILIVKLWKYIKRKLRDKYLDLKDRYENRTLFRGMKGSDDNGGTDA